MSIKKKANSIGKLFFLMGVARAGKSTIARQWQQYEIDIQYNTIRKHIGSKKIPRIIVNADWLRLALTGQVFVQEAEDMVHAVKHLIIRTYLNNGYDVLCDGTHTTKTSIQDLLYIDKNADFFMIDTDINECKQRAIDSNQEYLIHKGVIDRMAKQMEVIRLNPIEFVDSLRPL
jgi:chloramphenicol 3-O-phosphotransferase